jgi:hypothetical protein
MQFKVTDSKKLTTGALLAAIGLAALIFGGTLIGQSIEIKAEDAASSVDTATEQIQSRAAAKPSKTGAVFTEKTELLAVNTPIVEKGVFVLEARDAAGNLKWTETVHNALTYTGQQHILNCYFKATGCPTATGLYIGLATATPTQTATLASGLTELSGATGYTRYQINAWTVSANGSSNNTANNTAAATWTAGNAWTGVTALFVTNVASGTAGTLVAYSALSATRTLQNGDTLNVTYTLTLQ